MSKSDLRMLARGAEHEESSASPSGVVPRPPRRWKTRAALPAAIVLATAGIFGAKIEGTFRQSTPVRAVAALVKETGAASSGGEVVVQAPGWVEADPFPIAVSALASGVVDEVLALEGERVRRGQVVARLVADEARIALSQAESVLKQREAALASARAALEEARGNWEHPIELRRRVQTAEADLSEKLAELERWPAELAREEAHARYLSAEYERVKPLQASGSASDIELIEARQAYEAQAAEVEAVRRLKPMLEAQIRSLEAEALAAREDLRLRIADRRASAESEAAVMSAEASVAEAQAVRDDAALRLERMEIRSPADGVVMTRRAAPGLKLMLDADNPSSAQALRIYDPQRLQARVDIPLADAAKIGVGQRAEVTVDVLPDRVFEGRVTRIVHEADVQKNTLQVKVAIENPTPEIKPEMLARARFFSEAREGAASGESSQSIFAPRAAVHGSGEGAFVWLADQVDETARKRPVRLGRTSIEDWIAVTEGLRPGDRLIVEGPADLTDGRRIRLIED